MSDQSNRDGMSQADLADVRQGLRMAHPPDPAALAAEKAMLADLETKPATARLLPYLKLIGPGYLQSAMTLGGGTAAASLFAGAAFGYELLWVAPVAAIIGLVMLSAISHQTLSTGMHPFEAMRRYAGAPFAYGWAIGALAASVIWHFPQYALASAVLADMGDVFGVALKPQLMAFVVLAWAILLSSMYGSSPAFIRWYERLLKYMVWGIVLCFAWVVLRTGIRDWGELFRGFLPFKAFGEANGVKQITIVVSGLAAAVGINMVFLFPYSQLARGWGREHRRLARFDLLTGLFVPYVLAASLMIIATANTINLDPSFDAQKLSPVKAAEILGGELGTTTGRLVFGVGILGMALSSITLHMLCAGFVCTELFGWKFGTWKYRLGTVVPAVGVFGPVLWNKYAMWIAVPTNIICGLMLPLAYLGFIKLQASKAYLGDDRPSGGFGRAWLGAMIFVTVFFTGFLLWFAVTRGPGWIEQLGDGGAG